MIARLVLLLASITAFASATYAQTAAPDDGVPAFLGEIQRSLETHDDQALRALIDPAAPDDQVSGFVEDLVTPDIQRAVVNERDRVALENVPAGDGYRLIIEIFVETARRARILTSLIDVRRVPQANGTIWRITATQGLTSVEGLNRLRVNTERQLAARNLSINAEDMRLTLAEGTVFQIDAQDGVTGLVLIGRGEMRFTPAPATEKGQLRIFAGSDSLTAAFDTAYVRLHPSEYEQRVSTGSLTPMPANPRLLRRAQEIFAREGPRSFNLDLSELSADQWYLLPSFGDFLAEVHTRKYDTLTYSRSGAQVEDITLFDRAHRRTLSVYSSPSHIAASTVFNEDDLKEYDVLDYNIAATISPERQYIDGLVRMRLRVQATQLTALTIRLADGLNVTAVGTMEYGRLLPLRVRNQNSVIVSLPVTLTRDAELTLVMAYSGRLDSQEVDSESLQTSESGQQQPPPSVPEEPFMAPEPNFLLSNRSYWYPQNTVTDYATASMRITVPPGYTCVASGDLGADNDVTLRDLMTSTVQGKAWVFRASEPLRYLALVVSKFVRIGEASVPVANNGAAASRDRVRVAVDANPRQLTRGRGLLVEAQDIMRFYAGLIGEAPYSAATVALVEDELPGGHSPGYFAVVNNPLPYSRFVWRNDPAAFQGFPEFFVAHELAHQWWGQAVGWRNYHEQWLSEGFAQYFAALYAQHSRGDAVFLAMLRQFRRWSLAEADEGPITLGYRLGHIKGNSRVFRAIVYNKGAAVLHMLRRTVGDDTFFRALRRFYTDQKFKKAGTEDLRDVFEAESGRSLKRFFDEWVYGAEIPRYRYTTVVAPDAVNVRFDQVGGNIVDLPVTVTVVYTDGRMQDAIVKIDDRRATAKVPVDGTVKQVLINRDFAAIGYFEQQRPGTR